MESEMLKCARNGVIFVLVVGGILRQAQAVEYRVNWTIEGTRDYVDHPLAVKFGDIVRIVCSDTIYSNFIYVQTHSQYDMCNTSVGNGDSRRIGECLGDLSLGSFDQRIQRPSGEDFTDNKVIDYRSGEEYFFFSASDGSLASARSDTSGGQCLQGLKMMINVVPEEQSILLPSTRTVMLMPIPTSKSGDPEGSQDRNPSSIPIPLIAGVAGGGLLAVVVILVILFGVMIFCCSARNSQPIGPSGQKNAEDVEGGKSGSFITTTSGGACTQDSEAHEMGETEKIILSDGDIFVTSADNVTTTTFQGPEKRGSKTQSSNAKKPPTHPVSRGSRNGTTSPTEQSKPTHSQSTNKPSTTGQSAKQAPGQSKQPARTGSVSKLSPTRAAPPPPSNGNQRPSSRRQEPREGPVRSPPRTDASANKKAKAKPKPTANTNIGNFMYP